MRIVNSVMAFGDSQNILELWQEVQVELYTTHHESQ